MRTFNEHQFKDPKGKDVFILFDEASSYWMIAYDYTILDKNYHSYAEAADYIHQTGCKEWEDE
jgi:hypothetical protein